MQPIFDETNLERLTLLDVLRRRAQQAPQKEAYTFLLDGEAKKVHMTYADLDREARRIAALLQDCTPVGGRVLLLYPPGLEYIAALFGCFYAGVVAVPAYPPRLNQSLKRIQNILQDAQITVALAPAKILTSVHRMLVSDQFMAHIHWMATDTSDQEMGKSYQESRLDPSALALLQYTSGSTGSPKGVMLTHENIMQNAVFIQEGMGLSYKDRGLFWLPPYHDMGLMAGILQTLFTDHDPTTVLMAPASFLQQPLRWLRAISSFQATISGGPNFAYDLCVKSATEETIKALDLSCWAVAFTGAEPVREETLERFAQTFAPCGFRPEAFYPCYGLAEATLFVSGSRRLDLPHIRTFEKGALETGYAIEAGGDEGSRPLVSCGSARRGQEVVIVDPEHRTRLADGTVGEIWVRGPNVGRGYWGQEKATAETFQAFLRGGNSDRRDGDSPPSVSPDHRDSGSPLSMSLCEDEEGPFLRTGDLGFCVDGELYITGRIKDLIIIRGRNLHPQDIEQVVDACHVQLRLGCGVAFSVEGQALGLSESSGEQLVVLQEVGRHCDEAVAQEVIGVIRQAVLSAFEVEVAALALLRAGTVLKTSSGKIQRQACRSAFLAGELKTIAHWVRPEMRNGTGAVEADGGGQKQEEKKAEERQDQEEIRNGVGQDLSPHALPVKNGNQTFTPNRQEIIDWLTAHIAERAHIGRDEIDVSAPFVQLGLNSLDAIGLSGELERWLGRSLSPTLVYDYPSIVALAQYLVGKVRLEEVSGRQELLRSGPAPEQSRESTSRKESDAIAIIGVGCRFPGAENPEAFWQMLHDGIDGISEVPASRFDAEQFYVRDQVSPGKMNTRWGGFLPQIELFDSSFFHISPREARHMDPQQRLLLEVAWETLENAGQAADRLSGSQTGVFIGMSSDDYSREPRLNRALINAYTGTGNAHSIAANRLSYTFDLRGPSMAIDTACSSSLVAVHQACLSLRHGECDLALAGGVNVILAPELMITFSQARMMSSDGRCRTFDEAADGYVRSEGCGLVLLKPLAQALQDGDRVLAIIRGSAINQDGRSNGLTAPNGPSQEAVIRHALHHAGVHPSEVSYVETHGSSTPLGDPIEVDALKAVFMQERSPDQPCLLGAVKTNIGHLEAAAGIAGLIKTVLCLQKGVIAPNLHFKTLNPHISFAGTTFEIPTEPRQWPPHARRFAGVSAFGFGGTNAHVILEGAERRDSATRLSERPVHLLTLSGRTTQALPVLAQGYQDFLTAHPTVSLADLCSTAQSGRTHFAHRLAVWADTGEQMRERLAVFAAGQSPKGLQVGQAQRPPAVSFLFTGQGSQYAHMGHQLYETQPTFRQALDECNRLLSALLPQPVGQTLDLLSILYPPSGATSFLNETVYAQPALFALEYALAQMWLSWGVKPDVVMGHSVGEYVAACVAGAFSLSDGLKLITLRGRLMQSLPERGTMAMIWAEPERVQSFVAPHEAQVCIAALNGPKHTVISGRAEEIQLIVHRLEAAGVRTHALATSHAFHSPLMEPMLDAFERVASEVAFAPLCLPLVCNLTGQLIHVGETLDAHYWRCQTREAVQFATGIQTLAAHGYELFLELGPTPVLSNLGKRCLPEHSVTWLSSLRQDHDDWHILVQSIASLYCKGCKLNWSSFAGSSQSRKIALPTYPFEREHCWFTSEEREQKERGAVLSANGADDRGPFLEVGSVDGLDGSKARTLTTQHTASLIDFGLIFFSSSEGELGREQAPIYQLVTESAKYADRHGFSSIWIPERHFTKEGWLYPSPVALIAALTRETSRIHLRAGSVVAPLHHPLRIAEDWAVVDHLSGGRVGVSFASGWHPNDFSLAPENYAERSEVMYRTIEIVRRLWRGESVSFRGGGGKLVELKTSPLPLQKAIPIWLTAAGNPQTFANAGKLGANLLTHLYNQSIDELAEKIRLYRDAREKNGYNPATGKVSVMLHTYIGADMETVRTQVMGPFSHYLQSASYLVNAIAYSRGQQADLSTLSEEDREAYLAFVTDRLIKEQRVLFGTPQTCASLVTQLQVAGVDEIACQMDFGVESDLVLRSLPYLNQLRELAIGTGLEPRTIPTAPASKATYASQFAPMGTNPVPTVHEINNWLYQLRWEAVDLPQPPPETQPGHWLIFLDQKGVGQRLAQQLEEQGQSCTLISSGENVQTIDPHHYQVNPANPQEIKQTVGTALATVQRLPLCGVIHLWSLDTTPVEALNVASLEADQILGVQSALSLIQALIEQSAQTRLWLITQGAQPVPEEEQRGKDLSRGRSSPQLVYPYTDLAISQAPLWGLGKTCAMEHPELWGGLIDLDPDAMVGATVSQLLSVLQGDWHEDQIALRGAGTYVARMVGGPVQEARVLHLHKEAAYLITGGLWGMGLECARWLVTRGARHLVLLGRSKLPPKENWDQVPPESRQGIQIAGIRAIEQLGAHIHTAPVDVADESQLVTFFEQYQQQGMPELRGIIHAASVWQDAQGLSRVKPLINLNVGDLTAVLRPKMLGGWLLSNLLKETSLDFFVSFSSAVTLFGSAAQGNYAAASEFLDVLAYYQHAHGQPALSIDWGAISEIGYGATSEGLRVHEYWESHGIGRLSPQQVLGTLELLIQEDLTRVGVLRVDWQLLRQSYPQMADLPLVSHLASSRKETGDDTHGATHGELDTNNGTSLLQTLRDAHEQVQRVILTTYIKAEVARILCIPVERLETEEPLTSLGFDSLMAIELKNRLDHDLQMRLPIVTLLQEPSITQLVKQVLALVPSQVDTMVAQTEALTGAVGTDRDDPSPEACSDPVSTELLSYNQKALWFLSRLEPESSAYNLLYAAGIQQHLDVPALQRAVQVWAARYPILTSTYLLENGEPVQQTHASQTLPLEVIDTTSRSLEDLKCLLLEASNRPIDLTKGPVLRLQLYRRADNDYILGFILHHIIADFWALDLLVDELALLYAVAKMDMAEPEGQALPLGAGELSRGQAAARHSPSRWPRSDFQHADYVRWQQSMLQSQEGEQHWRYWQKVLAGDLPVLNLPTDRSRPPRQTYKGASQSFSFNRDLVKRLRSTAHGEKVTLFTLMLTAYQVLLHRYSNQDDILVGTPALGRTCSEFERVIGSLTNPVIVRARVGHNPTFKELLQQTKRGLLAALEHQDFPFLLLTERLQLRPDLSYSPIYQTLFTWDRPRARNGEDRAGQGQALSLRPFVYGQQGALTDLTLTVFEMEDHLSVDFRYNVDLFDAGTIARMAEHFQTLLDGITNNLDQHIRELPFLPDNVRQTLLIEWNATTRFYPQDLCLHELFEQQVVQTPDGIAVVFEGSTLTYQELNCEANRLAHRLRGYKVGPDVLVGVYMERSLELVVALLAILKAGGAYVPLDPQLPQERLAFLLSDAQVPIVLTQTHLRDQLPLATIKMLCPVPGLSLSHPEHTDNPKPGVQPENLAYMIYTSGSTGQPKGAMNTHRGISNHIRWMQQSYRLSKRDRVVQKAPFSFDGSIWEFFLPLTTGASLIIASPGGHRDPAYLKALIAEQGVTTVHLVPSMLQAFLAEANLQNCGSLRQVMCGGEAITVPLQSHFFAQFPEEVQLHNVYGPTEAAVGVTFWRCQRRVGDGLCGEDPLAGSSSSRLDSRVPIGRPIANTQIYLLDRNLEPVPIGVAGELYIGGVALARGYTGRPELTAEKFIPNPFVGNTSVETGLAQGTGQGPVGAGTRLYRTGDLARYQADGTIEYLERIDSQVKIRGFRIELGEIESVLRHYEAVQDAVVVVWQDGMGEQRLVAYLLTSQELSREALHTFLLQRLPDYMVPAFFVSLTSFPLSPNGKIDRRSLPAPDLVQVAHHGEMIAPPQTTTEELLVAIWSELLGISQVSRDENFFVLGGHSLLATRLLFRVKETFQVELPLRAIFEASTLAALAQIIDKQRAGTTTSTVLTQDRAWYEDAILDSTIGRKEAQVPVISQPALPAGIFLTGATGFLGIHLLHELLQKTQATIYCLVRASALEQGRQKLYQQLAIQQLREGNIDETRIVLVPGDLALPLFGLSEQQFSELAEQIELIYHTGAMVHGIASYANLKATNVLGTQEVLRLASTGAVKLVHHISTLSALDLSSGKGILDENVSLDAQRDGLVGGYSQSKWVAEKLVKQANERGIPTCVYRVGRIGGHTVSGAWNPDDYLCRFIRGTIQLGCVPDLEYFVDVTPVDYMSEAIVYLSQCSAEPGKIFHLFNPNPPTLSDLIDYECSFGYQLERVMYEEWRETVWRLIQEMPEHVLAPLLPYLPEKRPPDQLNESRYPALLTMTNTREGLTDMERAYPSVNKQLIQTYLSYLVRSGFLPSPPL